MNFHINKTKFFLRLDEYGITIQMLTKLTNLSYHYLNKMFEGKTKKNTSIPYSFKDFAFTAGRNYKLLNCL